jgi:hypothetical protein
MFQPLGEVSKASLTSEASSRILQGFVAAYKE